MDIKKLDELVSVSGQVRIQDIPALKAAGVELIVCNRPDGEEPGQPTFEQIRREARACGIEATQLAFPSDQMGAEVPGAFARLLGRRWRLHAYCRSGRRSLQAFAAARALDAGFVDEQLDALAAKAEQLGFENVSFDLLKRAAA